MYKTQTNKTDPKSSVITRYSPANEYAYTLQEANLLYWGSSLLGFTYLFIHHFISQASEKPPFVIPELCFVDMGVAASGNNVANTSSLCRTYLVEELIDTDSEDFVKFVHNGNAVPLLAPEDPLYDIAQFLCFTQRIQYFKTDGAVFLLDLQGVL
ncbi:hypothetical protein DFH07DRAFT_745103 [Mycena maculata]|uniref:Alpha-type protein kinase domain-containing protein n=1 Tax=Mycena maculata TaxID=230809 RepID=A0AAD7NA68_9AGAR|nr:hypothetical protein DFH07DRAFT_745103 [Mycena maculata]